MLSSSNSSLSETFSLLLQTLASTCLLIQYSKVILAEKSQCAACEKTEKSIRSIKHQFTSIAGDCTIQTLLIILIARI